MRGKQEFILYLAAQFERVNFLSLFAQSLVHTAQVVTHHAELVFVAPLGRSQLILRETQQLQSDFPWEEGSYLHLRQEALWFTCKRVMFWLASLTSSLRDSRAFSAMANLFAKARHYKVKRKSKSQQLPLVGLMHIKHASLIIPKRCNEGDISLS